ncbi:putative activator of basal transcription 1 [Scophthalmus maximus]|uniref:Activator of basal transcription 1 n=1 Tax=Scophthalmus maximus TaxID=52904 RepID=A0A2U9BZY1_SCOMX|nr:putative activator of basal transcription 1 [Scophthalmus maximus]
MKGGEEERRKKTTTTALREKEERMTTAQREEEEEEEVGAAADKGDDDEDEEKEDTAADRGDEDGGMKKPKQKVCQLLPGIIYVGHIPPRLRPKHLRNMLSVYGEIGRVFLQPEDSQVRKRKKKSGLRRCDFTEGWVEFRDKRVAKKVAASLHNTQMGTRKRQSFSSDLWCIKYLHRFQWTHLSERLAYEQTVQQQRLRTEVSQAKRETNFYLNNVERSSHMDDTKRKRRRDGQQVDEKTWDFTQRQTEDEIQMKKKKKRDVTQKHLDKARLIQQKSQSNVSLLTKIFNSNQSA